MNNEKELLVPVLDINNKTSSALLETGSIQIDVNNHKYTGSGEIRLNLRPRAQIQINGVFENIPIEDCAILWNDIDVLTRVFINDRYIDVITTQIGKNIVDGNAIIKWSPRIEPIIRNDKDNLELTTVVFHLFNFIDFYGTQRVFEKKGSESRLISSAHLSSDQWNVTLQSLFDSKEKFEILRSEGGYQLTHIGCLRKNDGSIFMSVEAEKLLNTLRYFLSFIRGEWCVPICAYGYDDDNNVIWTSWSSPCEAQSHIESWFDRHHCEEMEELFPLFMARWANHDWQRTLTETVYWYVNANCSYLGTSAGVILTQAAIERIAFEYIVKEKNRLTVNKFKKLPASERILLLFLLLGLPLEISTDIPEILSLSKLESISWQNTPQALTAIRNFLVHPVNSNHERFIKVLNEAWMLNLWYLELTILAVCGYKGTYSNRLKARWVGQVEDVPWKTKLA